MSSRSDREPHLHEFDRYLKRAARRVDRALDRLLPKPRGRNSLVHESMRYTTLAEGKRLRPAMVILAYETCGGEGRRADPVAAALEMVHAFSLIHDDLPAMDDDDYRRGKPSNHKKFGEGVAILAGDALLTQAFQTLASQRPLSRLGPAITARLVEELSIATGADGVIGGQVLDLLSEGTEVSRSTLDYIHRHKTARLFTAALQLGAIAAGAGPGRRAQFARYGDAVGTAFQIVDDILGEAGTFRELGRDPGRDRQRGKATYPRLLGIEASHRSVDRLLVRAREDAKKLPRNRDHFHALVDLIDRRRRDQGREKLKATEVSK